MKDQLLLLDAIHLPLMRPEYQPLIQKNDDGTISGIVTHCNGYVNEVCQLMGWKGFDGMMANQIVDYMAGSDQWTETAMEKCQFLANQGTLVIAGMKEDIHGHVCVVVPGKDKTSGRYGIVPSVANVGKEIFIGKGVNWAFSSMPKFWAWRSTL